jgi:diacylglycerol kinase (ATP)
LLRLIFAFRNTCAGLLHAGRTERAVQEEMVLFVLALPMVWLLGAVLWDRVAMIGSILLLLAVDLLNTCAEKLCDHVTPEIHPQVKIVKDMGSAAVFCAILICLLIWGGVVLIRLGLVTA